MPTCWPPYASAQTRPACRRTVLARKFLGNLLHTIQEKNMPKGQQRGNKEAKKPKKEPAPAPVVVSSVAAQRVMPAPPMRQRTKH